MWLYMIIYVYIYTHIHTHDPRVAGDISSIYFELLWWVYKYVFHEGCVFRFFLAIETYTLLFIYSLYLFIYPCIHPSIHPFIHLHLNLHLHLHLYLCVIASSNSFRTSDVSQWGCLLSRSHVRSSAVTVMLGWSTLGKWLRNHPISTLSMEYEMILRSIHFCLLVIFSFNSRTAQFGWRQLVLFGASHLFGGDLYGFVSGPRSTRWCPTIISWFINVYKAHDSYRYTIRYTDDIPPINHSYHSFSLCFSL